MAESAVAKKLGVKPGQKLLLISPPQGFPGSLGPLPEGVSLAEEGKEGAKYDLVLAFVARKSEVDSLALRALGSLKPGGILWFAYPKKSSATKTDISRDTGWDALSAAGLRPVSLVAIDDTWSALRFRPAADIKPRS